MILIGTLVILLFPNGRPPSRRWRVLAWLSGAVLILASVSEAFSPGRLPAAPSVTNPLVIESARGALELMNTVTFTLLLFCFAASAISVILRFQRSFGAERQQFNWFASAAVLLVCSFPFAFVLPFREIQDFVTLSFAGLPIVVGVAILRYRLYDIDVIINRALVYSSLTATLAFVYVGSVVILQYLFRMLTGQKSQLAVVTSTLAIAALFVPIEASSAGVRRSAFLPQEVRRGQDPSHPIRQAAE